MPLNFKYRLRPTEVQVHALRDSMRQLRWGWNLAVRREKWARRMIRCGRASGLHIFLAEQARKRKLTGRRPGKLNTLISEQGLSREQALVTPDDVQQAWNRKDSGLSVEYARESLKAAKQSMVGGQLGRPWAKVIEDKGIFLRESNGRPGAVQQ